LSCTFMKSLPKLSIFFVSLLKTIRIRVNSKNEFINNQRSEGGDIFITKTPPFE
jgi:hypothetical protein